MQRVIFVIFLVASVHGFATGGIANVPEVAPKEAPSGYCKNVRVVIGAGLKFKAEPEVQIDLSAEDFAKVKAALPNAVETTFTTYHLDIIRKKEGVLDNEDMKLRIRLYHDYPRYAVLGFKWCAGVKCVNMPSSGMKIKAKNEVEAKTDDTRFLAKVDLFRWGEGISFAELYAGHPVLRTLQATFPLEDFTKVVIDKETFTRRQILHEGTSSTHLDEVLTTQKDGSKKTEYRVELEDDGAVVDFDVLYGRAETFLKAHGITPTVK